MGNLNCSFPVNMRHLPRFGLLLANHLRRWPNSELTLGQRIVFSGLHIFGINRQALQSHNCFAGDLIIDRFDKVCITVFFMISHQT